MAITLRCTECNKKISVDEAFTGSMCRCPYCKAIVSVPEATGRQVQARPAAPSGRPSRPDAPAGKGARPQRPAAPGASEHEHLPIDEQHIVMAKPVRIQGIFTLVLLGLLVLVLAGLAWALIAYATAPPPDEVYTGPVPQAPRDPNAPPPPSTVNPFTAAETPMVAGDIPVTPPVAYVVDAGGSMRPVIGFAAVIVYRSAMSLPDSANTLLLVMKDRTGQGLTTPLKGPANAEEDTARRMLKLLDTTYPSGATDGVVPEALQAATAAKAGTVVLLARGTLEDPSATSAMKSWTKKKDRRLILVSLGSHPMDAKQLENLAGEVGATFRSYDQYQLREFLNDAPLE